MIQQVYDSVTVLVLFLINEYISSVVDAQLYRTALV